MAGISIITPLYKGETYIKKLIQMIADCEACLKAYDMDSWVEYIMVNDSPSENGKYMRKYVETLAADSGLLKVIYIENDKNRGIHQSRVNGLRYAKGELVLFLDQDDRLERTAVSKLYQAYMKKKKCDMIVANGFRQYSDRKERLYRTGAAIRLTACKKMYFYGTDLIFSPGQCLIKKSAIPKEWKENILTVNGCDDFYLWLLMLGHHSRIGNVNECLYYHMETEKNYSASFEKMSASYEGMCELLEKTECVTKKEIRVLQRRLALKRLMRQKGYGRTKLIALVKNADIISATILYKLAGYH